MFRALLAHLQEALHIKQLVYCVRVMCVGCYQDWSGTGVSNSLYIFRALFAHLQEALHNSSWYIAVRVAPPEDEQVVLETCRDR
jgi:hypothetical protein